MHFAYNLKRFTVVPVYMYVSLFNSLQKFIFINENKQKITYVQ